MGKVKTWIPAKFLFPPFQLVSWVKYPPRCGGASHTHAMFQVLIVIAGAFHLADPDGKKMSAGPGECLVMPPGKPHAWASGESACEVLQILHRPLLLENYGDLSVLFGRPDAGWHKVKIGRKIAEEISGRLKAEFSVTRPADSILVFVYLLEIFSLVLRNFCREKGVSPGTRQGEIAAQRALVYIQEHYCEKLSLPALARVARLSASRFSEVFRDKTGCSPVKYLNKYRMERAGIILAHTGLSVKEVAERLGFESIHYFSRAFKRHFGRSPSAFPLKTGRAAKSGP
ncbi:MAG: AraC family transcriptional regulator [Kiritimatiellae bacterium]|jgi:AraC-like DNA-binding protein|nr:AraC family transcriptional regulator [Kiritimatiellia bacterium]